MPRIKTEFLHEGMVVSRDVKNIDDMLLIPKDCKLTARQIGILQAWGVTEIEVVADEKTEDMDIMSKMPPEMLAKLAEELKAGFWKTEEADPVYSELLKILLRRQAKRSAT